MIRFEEQIQLPASVEATFSVIADFSNLTDWDPGIISVQKQTPGKLKIGTEFEVFASFFFQKLPMKYTLTEYEKNKKVSYVGETDTVKVLDTIEFQKKDSGCLVIYKAEFEFKGVLANQEPLMKWILQTKANNAFAGMRRAFSLPDKIEFENENKIYYKFIFPVIHDFSSIGYKSAKKNFKVITSNLESKVAVVTGASSGIGFESALKLARRQATVILVGRNEIKLNSAKEKIISETGNENIIIEKADLSLLRETKSVAKRISDKFESIDILINNAGAMYNTREVTDEGYEKSIALLLYSPCLLGELLLPQLKKSKAGARIVNVSSGGMYTQKLDLEDLESNQNYSGPVAYAKAKRGLVIMNEYWANTLKSENISSFCMHPGWADTEAVRTSMPGFYTITKSILRTPEEGADSIFWLAASDELKNTTGGFYLDRKRQPTHIFFTEHSKEEEIKFITYIKDFLMKYI